MSKRCRSVEDIDDATGLIPANFTFSEAGEVVDNQFEVIYVS